MTTEEKDNYLEQAKETLGKKRKSIQKEIEAIPSEILKLKDLAHDKLTYQTMIATYRKRFSDLQSLEPSPYFNFCLVKLDNEKKYRELYFSKFTFDQEAIYSWVSPIAQIRFENPGRFSVEVNGAKQEGEIFKKDQYLITDGKILFLSSEDRQRVRELIYQEYFSTRKTAFVLPEIVAQMEKAQDQVVRADYGGPLIVMGPAGSGKTTLALHRVAYLLQSPETSNRLSDREVIVFVQDDSTRDYFSHLLPELGIRDVEITTLATWARKILPLDGWQIKDQEGNEDAPYIWTKIKSVRTKEIPAWRKDWFGILTEFYADLFDEKMKARLANQKKNKLLDRLDLAVLLKAISAGGNGFDIEKEYYSVTAKSSELKRKIGRFKAGYKLMVIDEFQNYLPEQLELFKQAINPVGGETVYIGDFNQRVRLGTINNLAGVQSDLSDDRLVKLGKVYRNTKEILTYLKSLGYEVAIPEMIKSGPAVEEQSLPVDDELAFVEDKIKSLQNVSVGILSHDEKVLESYNKKFGDQDNIKIMTLIDSQGVEFDTVFLVGVDDQLLAVDDVLTEVKEELLKIKKDLLYIALTRAMNSLYVLGRQKLSSISRS
jgi:DNA helicase IV